MMENLPRGRRSRRSSSNLNLSNISPLTTHFSLTNIEAAFDENNAFDGPRYSYIQGASAPTTPSVLSRAPSRKRPIRGKPTLSVPATPRFELSELQTSKSASHLLVERRTSYFEYHPSQQPRRHRRNESTEWVHRAGIALTSETRETKGQSWLASRASSTSLLDNESSDEEGHNRRQRGSVNNSSRRSSQQDFLMRQKSRSRTKLLQQQKEQLHIDIPEGTHPLAPEFIDEAFMGSAFDDEERGLHSGEDGEDEEEDLHWSTRPASGVAAWVDRMVGWSLFSVDEEFDSDDERPRVVIVKAEVPPRLTLPNPEGVDQEGETANPPMEDVSVWADAGWVLSMAAKALF